MVVPSIAGVAPLKDVPLPAEGDDSQGLDDNGSYGLEPIRPVGSFPAEAGLDDKVYSSVGRPEPRGGSLSDGSVESPPPVPSRSVDSTRSAVLLGREPWYYVFLDRYAVIVTRGVIAVFILMLTIGAAFYLNRLYLALSFQRQFRASFWDLLWSSGEITAYFLVGLVMLTLFFLVPVLFALALIHVVVDAGRNIRALRAALESRE
jgi:hypothetical protein